MADTNSPILAPPKISVTQFAEILRWRGSPAAGEAYNIFNYLVGRNVDPEIALGQFAAESNYGKAGYATATLNWGNILYYQWIENNCSSVEPYAPGNGYTYSKFRSWSDSVSCAYAPLMVSYDRGGYNTLYKMSARWLGATPGSTRHTNYLNNITYHMDSNRAHLGLDSGEEVMITVPLTPKKVTVPTNGWIYDNEGCVPASGNIQINPGRDMPLVGYLDNGNYAVGYVPASNPPDKLKVYYCKPGYKVSDSCGPTDCTDQIEAATAPLITQINELEEELDSAHAIMDQQGQTIDTLTNQNNKLIGENAYLMGENEKLESENTNLKFVVSEQDMALETYGNDMADIVKAFETIESYKGG